MEVSRMRKVNTVFLTKADMEALSKTITILNAIDTRKSFTGDNIQTMVFSIEDTGSYVIDNTCVQMDKLKEKA